MARRFNVTAQLRLAAPSSANVTSVIRSIQSQLNGVNVPVNIIVNTRNITNVQRSMRDVNTAATDAANSMEAFGRQSALAIRRYTAFAVATGSFLALGQAIKASFGEAIAFDKQLTKLRQVTGQSAKDIQTFNKTITELSTNLGVSSTKLVDVSLVLAQAGLSAKDTEVALRTLAKTELSATFDDIADTTEGAIAILNQFGGGVNNLERDLSSLNSVSAKFAVESSDLVVAVRRTGGAFQAAGGSLNELLALFTSVRQTTRESAETIATGFRTIFTRLQRTRTVNFLESLGINLRDIEGQFVGPYEAVRRLSEALKNISSTDPRFAQIVEELGGFRQVSKVIPLIQQFAISEKALSVALRSTNSLSEDAAIAQDSLSNKITKVKEEFAALIRELSQNAAIKGFVELGLQLASVFIKVADSLQTAIPLIVTLGTIGLSRGLRGFGSGFLSELGTTRRFASGGIVPGTGNGDTVPAMLTPGEFVMKKSAVQAIGAGRLAKMNRYADGGTVKKNAYVFDFDDTLATTEAKGFADFNNPSLVESAQATRYASLAQLRARKGDDIYVLTARDNNPGINGAITGFMNKLGINPAGVIGVAQMFGEEREPGKKPGTTRKLTTASKKARVLSQLAGKYSGLTFLDDNEENVLSASQVAGVKAIQADTSKLFKGERKKYAKGGDVIKLQDTSRNLPLTIGGYYFREGNTVGGEEKVVKFESLSKDDNSKIDTLKQQGKLPKNVEGFGVNVRNFAIPEKKRGAFYSAVDEPIKNTILAASNSLVPSDKNPLSISDPRFNKIMENIGRDSMYGHIFEGALQAYTKNIRDGGANSLLDFNNLQAYKSEFESLFGKGAVDNIDFGDAKLTRNIVSEQNVAEKAVKEAINTIFSNGIKRATGGGVPGSGSGDTVPALLTPGEFVINKKSAQAIGYNNLSKMNNVKKFASGGPVGNTAGASLLTVAGLNSVPILLKQFGFVNEGLNEFTNVTSSVVANFGLFNELLKTFKSNDISRTLARTDEGIQRFANELIQTTTALNDAQARLNAIRAEKAQPGITPARTAELNIEENNIRARNLPAEQKRAQERLDRVQRLRGRVSDSLSRVNRFNQFAAAGSAIAFAGGNYLKNKSEVDLQNGNFDSAKGKFVAAGALEGVTSGAGTGAAIGSLFGPAGTIGGAIIGGIAGLSQGIYSSYADIQSRIDKLKFDKFFDKFSKSIALITSGKATAANLTTVARSGVATLRERVESTKGADRQTAIGQVDSQIVNIETFLNELAKTSTSFEQFKTQAGGVISFFAEFTNQTLSDVDKKFKNLIENQNKEIKLSKERAILEARNTQRLRDIQNITAAFKDLSLSTEALASSQKSYTDFLLNGSFGAVKAADSSEIFSRVDNIANREQFNRVTSNIGSNFNDGGALSNELIATSSILQELPRILVDSTKDVLQEGDFQENVKSRLSALGSDENSFLTETIISAIRQKTGPEAKDDKIINEIVANPLKVSEELAQSIKAISDVFKEAAPIISAEIQRTAEAFSNVRALRQKIFEGETKRDEISLSAERTIADGTGREFDTRKNITLRRQAIARQSGVAALGGVDLTAGSVEAGRQRISQLDKQIQDAEGNVQLSKELNAQRSKEIESVEAAVKALNGLADASSDLSDLQDRLKRASEVRGLQKGFAETFSFGSPEQKRTLNQNAFRAIQLSQGARGPALQTPETLDFLKSVGSARLPAFGGQSGDEIIDSTLRDNLTAQGFSKENINAILVANESEKSIIQQIRDRSAEGVKAQEELNKILSDGIQSTLLNIETNTGNFLIGIQQLIADREAKQKEGLDLQKQAEQNKLDIRTRALDEIQGITTSRFSVSKATQQDSLRNNLTDFQKLKSLQTEESQLTNAKNLEQFLASKGILKEREDGLFGKTSKATSANINTALDEFFRNNNFGSEESSFRRKIIDILNSGNGTGFFGGENLNAYQNKLVNKLIEENKLEQAKLQSQLNDLFSPVVINRVINNLDKLQKAFEKLGNSTDRDKLKLATGGRVPGSGNKDSVPAVLMPGEFVMNKRAVAHYGADFMAAVNNRAAPMMARGGPMGKYLDDLDAKDAAKEEEKIRRFADSMSYYENLDNESFAPDAHFKLAEIEKITARNNATVGVDNSSSAGFGGANLSSNFVQPVSARDKAAAEARAISESNDKTKNTYVTEPSYNTDVVSDLYKDRIVPENLGSNKPVFQRSKTIDKARANNNSKIIKDRREAQDTGIIKVQPEESVSAFIQRTKETSMQNEVLRKKKAFDEESAANSEKLASERKAKLNIDPEYTRNSIMKDRDEQAARTKQKIAENRAKNPDVPITDAEKNFAARQKIAQAQVENPHPVTDAEKNFAARQKIASGEQQRIIDARPKRKKVASGPSQYDLDKSRGQAMRQKRFEAKTARQDKRKKDIAQFSVNDPGPSPSAAVNPVPALPSGVSVHGEPVTTPQTSVPGYGGANLAPAFTHPTRPTPSASPASSPVPSSSTTNRGANGTQTQSSESTNQAVNNFAQNSDNLVKALNSFPREISLSANHKVEVIFNGAEVLSTMSESVSKIAVAKAVEQINVLLKSKFPDAGGLVVPASTEGKK